MTLLQRKIESLTALFNRDDGSGPNITQHVIEDLLTEIEDAKNRHGPLSPSEQQSYDRVAAHAQGYMQACRPQAVVYR